MDQPNDFDRRTVLKTLGAGVVGTTTTMGTAVAHGGDDWGTPAWLLTNVWEMADREPSGADPADHSSYVPIYYIEPDATGERCAQVTKDFSRWEDGTTFKKGEWGSVPVDQTLHDIGPPVVEYSTLWHEHFVFEDGADAPYSPSDLENRDHTGAPLIDSGRRIQDATNVEIVSVPMVFNCPARPAQGEHLNYCD